MSTAQRETTRAVVFDLDDTLYPQRAFKRSGFRAVATWLAARGHAGEGRVLAALDAILHAGGPSDPHMLDRLIATLDLRGVDVAELVEVFRGHRPRIRPYPGVQPLLRAWRATLRLGLLTDGSARVQRGKVAALGLAPLFDCRLFSDELATAKPDPALYGYFEAAFGLAGAQLVYVGDNPAKDFVGARARGWRTVRVATGEHAGQDPPTPAHDADHTVVGFAQLAPLLRAPHRGAGTPAGLPRSRSGRACRGGS